MGCALISESSRVMPPSRIASINVLPEKEKREIYLQLIPQELLVRFHMPERKSQRLQSFIKYRYEPGSSDVEISLFHELRFPDPILYGHLADTLNGQIHVLLYILNDPDAPRFNVDIMPDGTPTKFGTFTRNLEAENAAMESGLAPGQVRPGLRLLSVAIATFEDFVSSLGHEMFFTEPLYYHNAVLFERHGFTYQSGRMSMEQIESGFGDEGGLLKKLDGSTPFRSPAARQSIRLRSWAIHDGILGKPFTDVTMYKYIGKMSGGMTCPSCDW
jgi:hypothetical protein